MQPLQHSYLLSGEQFQSVEAKLKMPTLVEMKLEREARS
jgi:hypothetical protein